MSQESAASVPATQPGISAKWLATQPMVFDWGRAFQSKLSSGMRFKTRRIPAISTSNSSNSDSAMLTMVNSLKTNSGRFG
jgi:hypothetical protein